MISVASLLGALRRAEEVLHKLGMSAARALQQCIEHVIQKKPHPPPNISVIVFVPNVILIEKRVAEEVYCAFGEDEISARLREAEGAKALLLEIVRRAAYDWVLYRDSTRPEQKALAEEAFSWLFLEEEGHPDLDLRKKEHKEFTGFLFICDVLDMDAQRIRSYVHKLTPNRVGFGRQSSRGRTAALPSGRKSSDKPVNYSDLMLNLLDGEK